MLTPFLTYINEEQLFSLNDKVLVAVSGGKDSMVLLDLLTRGGYTWAAAHMNYQLRGNDADADEAFVQHYCRQHARPCFIKRVATKEYAKSHGISTQMAARELRYEWFEELRQQEGFDVILTAHHLTDAFETALLNLTKGGSVQGLRGLLPRRDMLARPLLMASRREIDAYAAERGLHWREDASNQETHYQRNKLRLDVLPLLRSINPTLEAAYARTAKRLRAAEAAFEVQATRFVADVQLPNATAAYQEFDLVKLGQWQPHTAVYLESLYKSAGFSLEQLENLLAAELTGKMQETPTHVATRERTTLAFMSRNALQPYQYASPVPGKVMLPTGQCLFAELLAVEEMADHTKDTLYADADKIGPRFAIRNWLPGDYFMPTGMNGRKKLSDFFVDAKMSFYQKARQPLLTTADGHLIWVIGNRADRRFLPSNETINLIKFTIC